MGTPDFSVPSFKALVSSGYNIKAVVTQPDKPAGRGGRLSEPSVKKAALTEGIRVIQPVKIRTAAFAAELSDMKADLIVTAAYGRILPKRILDIPEKGCINVHASLLPAYRGAAPINHAIINGERYTGITTMLMNEGLDTGDILLQKKIEITENMTAGQLHDILAVEGAALLLETLDLLAGKKIKAVPQEESKATYAPVMTRESGLIDWTKSSCEVHNLVRGTEPWPCSYTFLCGKRLKIWKTELCRQEMTVVTPGIIINSTADGIFVSCGKGIIAIKELQFENSRRMDINECWHNFRKGEQLG